MSEYVDLDELRDRVYFHAASLDERFVWEKIEPDSEVAPVIVGGNEAPRWADGLDRYRLLDCAHREADREGDVCGHCGAFRSPHKVWKTKGSTARG